MIADASGALLAGFRMVGLKFLSLRSAHNKALTAASLGQPSSSVAETVRMAIAAATGGAITGLSGGLHFRLGRQLMGGIGVGSGSGAQDEEIATAALAAIEADLV